MKFLRFTLAVMDRPLCRMGLADGGIPCRANSEQMELYHTLPDLVNLYFHPHKHLFMDDGTRAPVFTHAQAPQIHCVPAGPAFDAGLSA